MSKNSPLQNVRAMTEWLKWALKTRTIKKPKRKRKEVEDSMNILIKNSIERRMSSK